MKIIHSKQGFYFNPFPTNVPNYFDEIEFWDSSIFYEPIKENNHLIIPARNITVYPEHPLNRTDKPIVLWMGKLIFRDVKKSERLISEYRGDPKSGEGFRDSYKIEDSGFENIKENDVERFILEGVLAKPFAWVTWTIESSSFALEVLKVVVCRDVRKVRIGRGRTEQLSEFEPKYLKSRRVRNQRNKNRYLTDS